MSPLLIIIVGHGLSRDSVHFMAKFDALLLAKQVVAAESLFNSQRRRGVVIDGRRYDSLICAWANEVWAAMNTCGG